jgi:hypothetical protein
LGIGWFRIVYITHPNAELADDLLESLEDVESLISVGWQETQVYVLYGSRSEIEDIWRRPTGLKGHWPDSFSSAQDAA